MAALDGDGQLYCLDIGPGEMEDEHDAGN
jgi:hypothetical protein